MTQLTLSSQLRDSGVARVSAHNREFLNQMRGLAKAIAILEGSVTMDDLRARMNACDIKLPDHPNAFGSVFKEKGWVCIGYKQSETASCHARLIRVWKWAGA